MSTINDAKKAYRQSRKEIDALIKQIQQKLTTHGKDDITWAHHGDLGYVKEQLSIIDQFLANED